MGSTLAAIYDADACEVDLRVVAQPEPPFGDPIQAMALPTHEGSERSDEIIFLSETESEATTEATVDADGAEEAEAPPLIMDFVRELVVSSTRICVGCLGSCFSPSAGPGHHFGPGCRGE